MEPGHARLDVVNSSTGWVVTGEIDAGTSHQFEESFDEAILLAGDAVHVDLAAVDFIDSSGLRVLLRLAERASATGGTVVVRNPSRPVRRLLAITGLESTFGLDVSDGSSA